MLLKKIFLINLFIFFISNCSDVKTNDAQSPLIETEVEEKDNKKCPPTCKCIDCKCINCNC